VLRELSGKDGKNDLALGEVSARNLNENILGVQRNLGVVRVDDWRKRKHGSLGVKEHWVKRHVLNDVQELLQLLILSQHVEKLNTVHLLFLFKSLEDNIFWWECLISDWSADFVIVVSSHRAKSSLSAEVLMHLVLQINERVVGLNVKLDITQNGGHYKRSDLFGLLLHGDFLQFSGFG
jgi:hypothetical protein